MYMQRSLLLKNVKSVEQDEAESILKRPLPNEVLSQHLPRDTVENQNFTQGSRHSGLQSNQTPSEHKHIVTPKILTPWSESASELYRPSDRPLSTK
jgi:hypothetical protein